MHTYADWLFGRISHSASDRPEVRLSRGTRIWTICKLQLACRKVQCFAATYYAIYSTVVINKHSRADLEGSSAPRSDTTPACAPLYDGNLEPENETCTLANAKPGDLTVKHRVFYGFPMILPEF
jgi:hypothetical protein